jgi:hypothetical protein
MAFKGKIASPSKFKKVTQGRNAMGFPAVGHPNVACGYGLVDAERLFAQAAQQGYI